MKFGKHHNKDIARQLRRGFLSSKLSGSIKVDRQEEKQNPLAYKATTPLFYRDDINWMASQLPHNRYVLTFNHISDYWDLYIYNKPIGETEQQFQQRWVHAKTFKGLLQKFLFGQEADD